MMKRSSVFTSTRTHSIAVVLAVAALSACAPIPQSASRSNLSDEEARRVRFGLGIKLGEECRITDIGFMHAKDSTWFCKLTAPANSPSLQELVRDGEQTYVHGVFHRRGLFDWFYMDEDEVQHSIYVQPMHRIVIGKEQDDGRQTVLLIVSPAQEMIDQTVRQIVWE